MSSGQTRACPQPHTHCLAQGAFSSLDGCASIPVWSVPGRREVRDKSVSPQCRRKGCG